MKVVTIVGTRPQYIKLDKKMPGQVIINTGQHYDEMMKDVFFKDLKLPKPDYELGTQELIGMIAGCITALKKEKPDVVIVYGDCRTTLAGAIAASDLNIPIAHVEAGMRCYRNDMPEERIRVIVDHMSQIQFVTDLHAGENLENEGIRENILIVGNTMFDTFNDFCPIPKGKKHKKYSYLSIHRQENADSHIRLEEIFEGIGASGDDFIFPVHPRTLKSIEKYKINVPHNIEMIDPVSYKENLKLISDE